MTTATPTEAFTDLVEQYQGLVCGVAFSVLGDRSLAEDVAQETFVAAWRTLGALRDRERPGAWLAGIARNLARNAHRRRARRRETGLAEDPETPGPPEDSLEREEAALLRRELHRIPERYREPLVLFYYEGRSVAQVARHLGLGEDAVKQRLSRGRKALRAGLAARLEDALERMRPGKGFTALVLAAVTTSAVGQAAAAGTAGKVTVIGMAGKQWIALVVAVAALGGGTLVVAARRRAKAPAAAMEPGSSASRAADPSAPASAPPAPRPAAAGRTEGPSRRLADPAARDRLLRAIGAAREQRRASRSAAAAPPAQEDGDLDKEYVRAAVQEILPLLKECYENALERTSNLEGAIVVNFTIEGEPEVGGLIGESEIAPDGTTIEDAGFLECVKESMYAVEIDPPTHGGVVHVTYPFRFAP